MDEQSHSGFHLSEAFVADMSDADSRTIFAADQLRMRVAMMIRALREQRGWTQTQLAERMNTKQPVISRIEDGEYGKLSVQTLLDVAAAFDLPLYIDLPEWSDWFALTRDFSDAGFKRAEFNPDTLRRPLERTNSPSTASALSALNPDMQRQGQSEFSVLAMTGDSKRRPQPRQQQRYQSPLKLGAMHELRPSAGTQAEALQHEMSA
ncbi:MAG: XRE family transcriptional regulator [Cytophagaceae bacterium]|nr:MAG: XRE family transcriptional regulator [Cytophagaceae bacterium]